MHILIVSACEKRALKRTRAVLDSYALRAGPQTWATPITEEGIGEVRAALRRTATRQTAVACYRNDGHKAMRLLWIVGSRRKFGPDGHFPAGRTVSTHHRAELPEWVRLTALLAAAGGNLHDWGKITRHFQAKLHASGKGPPEKDPLRHEWMSLQLFRALQDNRLDEQIWQRLAKSPALQRNKPAWFSGGIRHWAHVIEYLVATHHKLFRQEGNPNAAGIDNHVRPSGPNIKALSADDLMPVEPLPQAAIDLAGQHCHRAARSPLGSSTDPHLWRGVATIARAALVLADQTVSSRDRAPDDRAEGPSYANTKNNRPCQSLPWHLATVSRTAGDLVYHIATLRQPGLSESSTKKVLAHSGPGRFAWQDQAVSCLQAAQAKRERPTLVINLASTGSGKTRANAKIACALRPDGEARFVTALNLRTLTLQTMDAYRDEIGIGRDELACVIGDKTIQHLHESRATMTNAETEDEDGNADEEILLDVAGDVGDELPKWLQNITADRADRDAVRKMLSPAVLVSTVDTIVRAGDPHRQAHHAFGLLRLKTSDLILDELDSYDPKELTAVLRLVIAAGLFGRHVIASSATLPKPIAKALLQAYQTGLRMGAAMAQTPEAVFRCMYVDDVEPPVVHEYPQGVGFSLDEVANHFDARILQILKQNNGPILKRPVMQPVHAIGEEPWYGAVEAAVSRLHADNAWDYGDSGKQVSFGLVRCANIKTAIPLARELATRLPHARVACYHSQDLLIQRFHKEQRLDFLLNRKNGNQHIEQDPEIQRLVTKHTGSDVPFIVVATPVEEIGRDHDFDWAVIEPSSVHSIVQTAGRVNRHRRTLADKPNIAILQFNMLYQRTQPVCVFCHPGLETEENTYPHDVSRLFDWGRLDRITSAMRYDMAHPFSICDDQALENALFSPTSAYRRAIDTHRSLWTAERTYTDAPLRDNSLQQTWRQNEDGEVFMEVRVSTRTPSKWVSYGLRKGQLIGRMSNDWLTLGLAELAYVADKVGISRTRALQLTTRSPRRGADGNQVQQPVIDASFGWLLRSS